MGHINFILARECPINLSLIEVCDLAFIRLIKGEAHDPWEFVELIHKLSMESGIFLSLQRWQTAAEKHILSTRTNFFFQGLQRLGTNILLQFQTKEEKAHSKRIWTWLSVPPVHTTQIVSEVIPQLANLSLADSLWWIASQSVQGHLGTWCLNQNRWCRVTSGVLVPMAFKLSCMVIYHQ